MLSSEQREKARQRWMAMFDEVYPRCESIFSDYATLIVTNTEDLRTFGEDGKEYTLQVAPWERED